MGNQLQCQIFTVTATLFLSFIGILLLAINTEDIKEPAQFMYGIVLDAGSSHTAMYIYKWPADKHNGTGIVSQHSECHVQGGGISNYAGNRGGAAHSLEECMEQAIQDIPKSRQELTPLYLGATAGMRLLNISRPKESDEILKEVGDKLKTYPFSFKGATILSGQEEGAYGWVTVNYLLENYIKTQGSDSSIVHPCYPAGYNDSIKLGSVFDTPCIKRQMPYNSGDLLHIKGTGNYNQCLGNISCLFSFNNCSYSKCSFDGNFQPNITGNFMAFSAFFYTYSFIQKASGITISSPAQLEDAVRNVCNMSFLEITSKFPDERNHLKDYCADSVFMQMLLISGYGFNELSFPQISFQEKAEDTSVGWSLGYMLSLSNLLPAEKMSLRKALRPEAWRAAIFLFCVFLIVAIFFLLRTYHKNSTKLNCSPLSLC
ncbi:ectonucleoside triphosphate diphosphohydrolase 2 isoform X2 [Myxocyprinus asiaticus]|uniref:ectonucleoside triphosphate diphosphohydrolase 2 isoform X2 n=1 Tax=Myxocyprinus asiaticus TaxID=70543 RepID=UPI002223CF5A|nr:ectonucleoside triphosphate diphosphohydrolase 2 isoform X2 [Myxocyprinus asiaticus]